MTLREYAAIKIAAACWGAAMAGGSIKTGDGDLSSDATVFYRMADAMIAARANQVTA